MSNPLVTIITPTYNCGRFIKDTVESVLSQDYGNIHYLILDDGSTDDTRKILEPYDGRIIYLYHQNQGEQKTVNDGMRRVMGKYFFILNSDDKLLPGAVSKLVDFMEANPDVLCAYPDWNMIGEDGAFKRHVQTREYDFGWMVRHHTWLMSVGSIFRSDVIKLVGYRDESFTWLGDGDYWLRIGLVGKMARVPETLACWRHREGQASRAKSSIRAREHIRVIDKFYYGGMQQLFTREGLEGYRNTCWDLNPKATYKLMPIKLEAFCWAFLVAATVTDSFEETIKYIRRAIKIYPRLLLRVEFWDILIKRAIHVLRR